VIVRQPWALRPAADLCYLDRFPGRGATRTYDEDPYTFLLRADRPEEVEAVREALDDVDIPYRTGLMAGERPSVFFTVPKDRLEHARAALAGRFGARVGAPGADKFPWRPVQTVGALILFHFALVFAMIGSADSGRGLIVAGSLLKGATIDQPWRLVTSLFLHVDPLHVFWNSASMMVFSVPLLLDRGYLRTAAIYFSAGIGGGVSALYFASGGTMIVGSSGAVAGLFGAWVVLALDRDRWAPLTGRARVRTLGIAMLVLPSLLSPMNSTGQSVSVSSHLGGLATGMAIGVLLSTGMLRRRGGSGLE